MQKLNFSAPVCAKNPEQKEMLRTISKNDITFIKGSPGTGKTYLAVGYALQELSKEHYEKIILSRPVVEAGGERLGFLPGEIEDKIDPYMLPLFYSMEQILKNKSMVKKLTDKNGSSPKIRVLPLAYMRGITFSNAIIICDEMQNATPNQMRMVLTRFGQNSKMIICGDVRQSDIHQKNGLENAFEILQGVDGLGFCTLSQEAIVRHPVIGKIEDRYEENHKDTKQ